MVHDLAFIGSGLAATAALIQLLPRLPHKDDHPWRIAVLDAGGWFGGGVTYSGPAAADTLLQNPVRDMPPALDAWLKATPLTQIETWADGAGRGGRTWFLRDRAALSAGETEGLFVPRALYGHVQEARYRAALAESPAEVSQITARVQGLSGGAPYRLDLGPDRAPLKAAQVVLCPGLIPRPPIPAALSYLDQPPAEFVRALTEGGAVLGANAAAMDVMHLLDLYAEHLPTGAPPVRVLSRSGQLPPRFDPNLPETLPPSTLMADPLAPKTAAALVEVIAQDAQAWAAAGIAPSELGARGGMAALMQCLGALPPAERQTALQAQGPALSLLSRRAVPAYRAAADRLVTSGRVRLTSATVENVTAAPAGGAVLHLQGQPDLAVPRVVDCRGAGRLGATQDPLLQGLHDIGLLPNAAGSGFAVNDQLCAAPGLYVLGDLLTGYDGAHGAIWHLQSAPRIQAYAEVLAEVLSVRYAAAANASR